MNGNDKTKESEDGDEPKAEGVDAAPPRKTRRGKPRCRPGACERRNTRLDAELAKASAAETAEGGNM